MEICQKTSMRHPVFALCIATCLIFLFGCANDQKTSDQLAELAEQYWTKRLIERDYKFTYNLELEEKSLSFSDYCQRLKASEKFGVLSVKIKEVTIEGDKGIVYLTLECSMAFLPKPYKLPLHDVWLYRSNKWKHKFSHK